MDEGRKRVIGIMAAILASLHMRTADDFFGGPQGSPGTDGHNPANETSLASHGAAGLTDKAFFFGESNASAA